MVVLDTKLAEPTSKEVIVQLSKEIKVGISAVKKFAQWPKKVGTAPPFSDESATLFMKLIPKNKIVGPPGHLTHIRLPHPLSYNRSVCVITSQPLSEDENLLREEGILGELKLISRQNIKVALKRDTEKTVEELVQNYDTFIAERKSLKFILKYFIAKMDKLAKAFTWVFKVPGSQQLNFKEALAKSNVCVNTLQDAYVMKVAHSGHTDIQIQENIAAALNSIVSKTDWFPQGLKHFTSVELKTGKSKAVNIYVNKGEVVVEPLRLFFTKGGEDKPQQKRKATDEPESDSPRKVQKQAPSNETDNTTLQNENMAASVKGATPVTPNTAGKKKRNKRKKSAESPLQILQKKLPSANGATSVEEVTSLTANTACKKKRNKSKKPGQSPLQTLQEKPLSVNGAISVEEATSATPNSAGKKKKIKQKMPGQSPLQTLQKKPLSVTGATSVEEVASATPNSAGKKKKNKRKMPGQSPLQTLQENPLSVNGATSVEEAASATPNSAGKKKKNRGKKPGESLLPISQKKEHSPNGATSVEKGTAVTPNTAGKRKRNRKRKSGESPIETLQEKQQSLASATPMKKVALVTSKDIDSRKENTNMNASPVALPSGGKKKRKISA